MPYPPPIVHGSPTNGLFSEVGSLVVDYGNSSHLICTGTLISSNVVLTAGHCSVQIDANLYDSEPVYFIMDEFIDLQNSIDTPQMQIVSTVIHPAFDTYLNNDISLVFLQENASISPAKMDIATPDLNWQNLPFSFVGFGNTSENANDEGRKLQTKIPYYDNDDMFHYAIDLSGEATTNLCYGDSGGPMYRTMQDGSLYLVGVNSFVFSITDEDLPCSEGGTGSIRIDMYAHWIADEMGLSVDELFSMDGVAIDAEIDSGDELCINDGNCEDGKDCSEILDTGEISVPKSGCQTQKETHVMIEFYPLVAFLIVYGICVRQRFH